MIKPPSNPAKTVLTICLGFLVVFLITKAKWALTTAVIVGLAGLFSDFLAKKIEWLWMKLAQVLALIVPNILLGAIFYLFLFPVALLSRLFGKKDPMRLKNSSATVWVEKKTGFDAASFEKPW